MGDRVESAESVGGVLGLGVELDEAVGEEGVEGEERGFKDAGVDGFGGEAELAGDAAFEEVGEIGRNRRGHWDCCWRRWFVLGMGIWRESLNLNGR